MKMSLKPLTVCTLIAFTFFASCAQEPSQEKTNRITNISINNWNHDADISSGFWTASREDGLVYVGLHSSRKRNEGVFNINFTVKEDQFEKSTGSFKLVRDAGTIHFKGDFPSDEEAGTFTFDRNQDFESFLKSKISSDFEKEKDYYFLKLFLGDVNRAYVNGVLAMDYDPTLSQLGKLGIHGVTLDYISRVNEMDYDGLDLDMIIRWDIHGVTLDYLEGLAKAGYGIMDADEAKKFAIHGVSLDFMEGLAKNGYRNMDTNMIIKFAIHGISTEFLEGLSKAGYRELDPSSVTKFAIHGVSVDYIRDLSKAGYDLEPDMIIKFAIHGIDADYVTSLLSTDISKPDASTIQKAKIHGVTSDFITRANRNGHESSDLHDYIKWKIRGV